MSPSASTPRGRPGVSNAHVRAPLRERFGICQWFHFQDELAVERTCLLLRELGIRHLRTGISWADYYRPGGSAWYSQMLTSLREFELLVSVWHTPPSISLGHHCASPPRRVLDYADFIDHLISEHRGKFAALELWNEPNNRYKWDFRRYDPAWRKFGEMVGCAAYWARQCGVPTVLGGMMPVDPHWLDLMGTYGVIPQLDRIGIHGFPGMWWDGARNWDWHHHWMGWAKKIDSLSGVSSLPVWITETGLATWCRHAQAPAKHELQAQQLVRATLAPAERTYWYSLIDLDPRRAAIEGFHVDENEYHLGLVTHAGRKKKAFHTLQHLLADASATDLSAHDPHVR
jgi:CDP-paratose 2-epimerase